MRPGSRLDSAVFQLTPTRTRCDLVITANGETEKIASGLLNPFLAHLKAAQDQITKGGYSIALEADAPWFTKGTVERFVRFVSTPEVLERVSTIESEILQIEEAISIQGNESLGLSTVEYHHQTKPTKCIEGGKAALDADAEKAIVLYKPDSHPNPLELNGCTMQEENSKVQLLRVLETRKTMLQKEQGMAFARAAAAGFNMDHMAHLISFAECFGASRLKEACVRYMELWKRKHETGQWLEVDAAEAMSFRSEFASLNASGIILSGDTRNQKEFGEAWPTSDVGAESNAKAGNDINPELNSRDQRHPSDPQVPRGPHEYFHGQYQHPTYPQWPMHVPPGQPMFQPYPMQGMPYYQSYPGNGQFFQPPYPSKEDSRFTNPKKTRQRRHSANSKDSSIESEASEMGVSGTRSHDDAVQNASDSDKEVSHGRESRRRHGRSRKKQSGMVVIRNINYITSKRPGASGSESGSAANSENEEENEGGLADILEGIHKKSSGSLKKKEGHKKYIEISNTYTPDAVHDQEHDSGNWQAFQSFLLKAEEKTSTVTEDVFAGEKYPSVKKRHNTSEEDPIFLPERDSDVVRELGMEEFDSVNSKASRARQAASNDVLLISSEGRGLRDDQMDSQFKEIDGGRGGYRRMSDDFIIYGQEKQISNKSSSHPLAEYEYNNASNSDRYSYNATDESFMVPFRSGTQDQLSAEDRTNVDMDSEYPSSLRHPEHDSNMARNQPSYEPDDLTLMPDRDVENGSFGYDPARDNYFQAPVDESANMESRNQENVPAGTKEVSRKLDNGKNLKAPKNGLEKRKEAIMKRGTSSKLNPLAEAQKRAETLRAYKADLQKTKKEQEEEQIRRLEALKRERQKRIAARSGSATAQSPLTPKQNRASLPAKVSPSSYKGSKFSDSEPGSSSSLQKLPIRTTSTGFVDSQKNARSSRIISTANRLSSSVSSLPELKKESNGFLQESTAASIQLKRLSDPKGSSVQRATSVKPLSRDQVTKKNTPKDPRTKISAIMQLDKTKSATLPELKIKTPRAPTAVHKSVSKETQKATGSKTYPASESIQARKSNEKSPRFSNMDDNPVMDPVIEKSVVMLETETVPAPIARASKDMIDANDKSNRNDGREGTGLGSEYEAIRAPPSPAVADVGYSNETELNGQLSSSEVVMLKDETQKSSNATPIEKPYQAPYARASSLEDPATNKEYFEAPPVLCSKVATTVAESNFRTHVPSSIDLDSMEESQETYEKSRTKQSKGFRKLLKFGRKSSNSASGEGSLDSDGSVVDVNETSSSSSDVQILKNLISQDDAHVAGTPPKVSRPFSLLSPFRSKTSDKKLAVA